MVAKAVRANHRRIQRIANAVTMLSLLAGVFCGPKIAWGYVSEGFLEVPGIRGGWQGEKYKNWIRVEARQWGNDSVGRAAIGGNRNRLFYSGPTAPRQGPNTLVISIDKRSPAIASLMDQCVGKKNSAEITFAESSLRARGMFELGPRPADMPEYFEYKLKDIQFSDCPVVAGAPEQAFVVSYHDIEWINYRSETKGKELTLQPANLTPAETSGATKVFVVTWLGAANDVSADQCPQMNSKPTATEYYALMSKQDADKERTDLASKGGVSADQVDRRGPGKLNVCMLPGIVPVPSFVEPRAKLARGLNLDGDDGTGKATTGTCKHKNYASEDGRVGIDNQRFTFEGCITGYRGRKSLRMESSNENRRSGLLSILVEISGIDNEQNDNSVDVTLLYSLDPMAKDASGTKMLPDYTFRVTDKPEYTHYFTRLHGKIANGTITTEPIKELRMNWGQDPELRIADARMRLELMPDGTLKGLLGGYEDWHDIMVLSSQHMFESYFGFQCPGVYNALKSVADGMKDPVTGECNGVSSAYDIEGVRAFIPPTQSKALNAGTTTSSR